MMDSFDNNNEGDSSIYLGILQAQDLSAEQKLRELKGAAEEIARKVALKTLELEREACGKIDETSSQATLAVEQEDEDYFTNGIDSLLKKLYEFFGPVFNEFEIDADPKIYEMMKEKKEKSWILSLIKFIQDKLKKLIKKICADNLTWNERLAKEIKELEEKLAGGGLSPDEFARVLERLEALQGLKLKLQMFLVCWLVTTFSEIFAVDLVAAIEHKEQGATKDKKAEKTLSKEEKEASKEVRENAEIKMDEKKPQLIVPIPLFNISPIFARPIVLTKLELDLFSKPIKDLLDSLPKEVINNEVQKPKVEEKKKKVKMKELKPAQVEKPVVKVDAEFKAGDDKSRREDLDKSSGDKIIRRSNKRSLPTHTYPINNWQEQVPSGNGKSNASAAQQVSVGDAQPSGGLTNVEKVNNHVESIGKAPEKAPLR